MLFGKTATLALFAFAFVLYSVSAQSQNDSNFTTYEEWIVTTTRNKTNQMKKDCFCVSRTLCNINDTLFTNSEPIIDIRFNPENDCYSYMDVCCKKENILDSSKLKAPDRVKAGCGTRNSNGIGFRIQGNTENESEFGEFPWMVAVLTVETVKESNEVLHVYSCGGALIHPQVVLTAAHCVISNKDFLIRAGEWDTQMEKETLPHQVRRVASIKVHEDFQRKTLYNDVALLFLENPLDIAENVNVVCLPAQDANFDHSKCVATGWGKGVFGKKSKYQVILRKMDFLIVPNDSCQSLLRSTRLGQKFNLHKSFICSGGEIGKDTCKGDGGGPLVCPIKGSQGRYQQAGIVAWSIGCASSTPRAYVNVALFRGWIDRQMAAKNFGHESYQD